MGRIAVGMGWALGLVATGGCGTIVVTPPASVADPVTVSIIDVGNTSFLALPREDGTWTSWGFGEWWWYAKNQTWVLGAPITVLVPTPGALARRDHGRGWSPAGEAVHPLRVERARASALLAGLDRRWADGSATEIDDELRGLRFVRDPRPYWLFSNSTSEVGGWVRELGCTVRGWSFIADYRVEGPGAQVR